MNLRSKEELYFTWWLDELRANGFIIEYDYEPITLTLSEKVEIPVTKVTFTKKGLRKEEVKMKTILHAHEYTPDFKIKFSDERIIKVPLITSVDEYVWIDVKSDWNQNNMNREFSINQKWVYQKHNKFVNKVVPEKLFKATFTPERYLLTDVTNKPRKIGWAPRSLTDYLDGQS
jgi:hypothetical protein